MISKDFIRCQGNHGEAFKTLPRRSESSSFSLASLVLGEVDSCFVLFLLVGLRLRLGLLLLLLLLLLILLRFLFQGESLPMKRFFLFYYESSA